MKSVPNATDYEEVKPNDHEACDAEAHPHSPRILFLRQLLISSTMWTLYFLNGFNFGTPTVLIPQLKKEREIDDDTASWITSIAIFGGMPWVFILPVLSHSVGRKVTFIFVYITAFVGFLVLYCSKNLTQLYIGQIISGVVVGCLNGIGPVTLNEYVSPKYRGIFLTIKSASVYWGIWVSNVIGTFMNWKNISIVAFVCNIYTLTVFFWPESPYWLAKNGKFAECSKSHRWLKGTSIETERELGIIISSYKSYREEQSNLKLISIKEYLNNLFKTATNKAFYKPISLASLIYIQYYLTGKLICSMYAIEIIKTITKDEPTAYRGMLILDGITVFSVYCGCFISQFIKRRTYLLTTSTFAILFLYSLSLYLHLIRKSIIAENHFITIGLLGLYSISVSAGPIIMLTSVASELIPIRYQRAAIIINGASATMVLLITTKSTLFLFKTLTYPGVFLFYAILSTVVIIVIYLYLPETKDKTLLEIEHHFSGDFIETDNSIGLMKSKQSTQIKESANSSLVD